MRNENFSEENKNGEGEDIMSKRDLDKESSQSYSSAFNLTKKDPIARKWLEDHKGIWGQKK
jgi:hypothetical protein